MADQPRETEKARTEAEKKQAETVQLTAEELRKISGGINHPAPIPIQQQTGKAQV